RTFPNATATAGTLPASIPSDTKALLLVNQTAMGRTYGQTAADALMTRLRKFATDHPDLKAVVVPVDGDGGVASAKTAWDASPCSIPAANDVVRKINALVARLRAQASGIEYLTIVGSDEQIPMARVVDKTTDANESTASGDLAFTTNGLTRANALFASEFLGYTLTDDAYAAGDLVPWFGNELYLPQFAVGRLVETPDDVSRQLDRYDTSGGMLNPSTGVVAGYDFMRDMSKLVRSSLTSRTNSAGLPIALDPTGAAGNPFILASDNIRDPDLWTQGDASPYFSNPLLAGRGILRLNGHYNHWELASSSPTPITVPTLVPTSVLPTGPNAAQLANAILFTMGCHAGLSVSD